MRSAVVISVVAILVVASLGAGYLAGSVTQHTETLTSTSTLMPQQTITSTLTSQKTITSTITSTMFTGQPIPVASIETWNVTLGGQADVIATNAKTNTLYITDLFSSNLTVVSAPSQSVIARIVLPSRPSGIAVDDSTNMVYASVSGGIVEINGTTNQVVGQALRLGIGGPIAYDPLTHVMYGASGNDTLAGADIDTGAAVANFSLGYPVSAVALNPETDMIYVAGCEGPPLPCNSAASLINGTTDRFVTTVNLRSGSYPALVVNPATNVVYVSGDRLVALNGTNGNIIFSVNPLECGPFLNMVVIPSLNEVAAAPQDWSYVLVYDGATGALLNMYSVPNGPWSGPWSVAFNPQSDELYADVSGELSQLVSFPNAASTGSVDSALMGSGQNCPLP